MESELVGAISTVIVTVAIVFAGLVAGGFALISRRKRLEAAPADTPQRRANIQLVRADDAVKTAEEELAFAIAQFGDATAREFDTVLQRARGQLREAFALQQKLDDAVQDTPTQQREWTARILNLCEQVQSALAGQQADFDARRQSELGAPAGLAAVRDLIATTRARRAEAGARLESLRAGYAPNAIAPVSDNLSRADGELTEAERAADETQAGLSSGSGAVAAAIRTAEEHAHRAVALLDAIHSLATELGTASAAVADLRESTRANLADARALRDAPPDAAASEAVSHAIESVEAQLAATDGTAPADPLRELEALRAANAALDSSMAGARNQQRRLDGARTALVGALVTARSQLAVTRDFIAARRGGVGAEARTRLAEAERMLTIAEAEAEADPVAALDAARSSATHSRDADALARYDLMGRRR